MCPQYDLVPLMLMSTKVNTAKVAVTAILPITLPLPGKMGIKPNNFSVKKQRDTWTEKEIEKLLQFIENEETENYLMLELMRAAKKEETVSYEEFKKQVGWK